MTDTMKDGERGKPILFSVPMIRALLAGTKTQTRRAIKPQPEMQPNGNFHVRNAGGGVINVAPENVPTAQLDYLRVEPGDRLWVREAARGEELESGQDGVRYRADDAFAPIASTSRAAIDWLALHTYRGHSGTPVGPWAPGIHIPRWASRLTLIVTDVRVQRLQDISEEDARAEGLSPRSDGWFAVIDERRGLTGAAPDARAAYALLWTALNGTSSWAANPWVAAYTFTVHRQNIDALPLPAARDAASREVGG